MRISPWSWTRDVLLGKSPRLSSIVDNNTWRVRLNFSFLYFFFFYFFVLSIDYRSVACMYWPLIVLLLDDASSGGHVRQPINGQQLLPVTSGQ